MVLEIARGLRSAGRLQDDDGNTGNLDLGIVVDRVGARASLTATHQLTRGWGDLSAFASVDAGHRWDAGWETRALAGIRIEW